MEKHVIAKFPVKIGNDIVFLDFETVSDAVNLPDGRTLTDFITKTETETYCSVLKSDIEMGDPILGGTTKREFYIKNKKYKPDYYVIIFSINGIPCSGSRYTIEEDENSPSGYKIVLTPTEDSLISTDIYEFLYLYNSREITADDDPKFIRGEYLNPESVEIDKLSKTIQNLLADTEADLNLYTPNIGIKGRTITNILGGLGNMLFYKHFKALGKITESNNSTSVTGTISYPETGRGIVLTLTGSDTSVSSFDIRLNVPRESTGKNGTMKVLIAADVSCTDYSNKIVGISYYENSTTVGGKIISTTPIPQDAKLINYSSQVPANRLSYDNQVMAVAEINLEIYSQIILRVDYDRTGAIIDNDTVTIKDIRMYEITDEEYTTLTGNITLDDLIDINYKYPYVDLITPIHNPTILAINNICEDITWFKHDDYIHSGDILEYLKSLLKNGVMPKLDYSELSDYVNNVEFVGAHNIYNSIDANVPITYYNIDLENMSLDKFNRYQEICIKIVPKSGINIDSLINQLNIKKLNCKLIVNDSIDNSSYINFKSDLYDGDELFKKNEKYYVKRKHKAIPMKNLDLDNTSTRVSLGLMTDLDSELYHHIYFTLNDEIEDISNMYITSVDGRIFKARQEKPTNISEEGFYTFISDDNIRRYVLVVPNEFTGWYGYPNYFTPVIRQIKAFFNGWKSFIIKDNNFTEVDNTVPTHMLPTGYKYAFSHYWFLNKDVGTFSVNDPNIKYPIIPSNMIYTSPDSYKSDTMFYEWVLHYDIKEYTIEEVEANGEILITDKTNLIYTNRLNCTKDRNIYIQAVLYEHMEYIDSILYNENNQKKINSILNTTYSDSYNSIRYSSRTLNTLEHIDKMFYWSPQRLSTPLLNIVLSKPNIGKESIKKQPIERIIYKPYKKNLAINPNFIINQRGKLTYSTNNNDMPDIYTMDMWKFNTNYTSYALATCYNKDYANSINKESDFDYFNETISGNSYQFYGAGIQLTSDNPQTVEFYQVQSLPSLSIVPNKEYSFTIDIHDINIPFENVGIFVRWAYDNKTYHTNYQGMFINLYDRVSTIKFSVQHPITKLEFGVRINVTTKKPLVSGMHVLLRRVKLCEGDFDGFDSSISLKEQYEECLPYYERGRFRMIGVTDLNTGTNCCIPVKLKGQYKNKVPSIKLYPDQIIPGVDIPSGANVVLYQDAKEMYPDTTTNFATPLMDDNFIDRSGTMNVVLTQKAGFSFNGITFEYEIDANEY